MLQQLRMIAAGALLTLPLLAPAVVRAMSELPPDSAFCEQVRRGQIVFSDGSNPCVDPEQTVILVMLFAVMAGIAVAVWSARTGARKGYGLLTSLSASPFLLNELPAKPGSEEERATRKAALLKKKRTIRSKTKTTPRRKRS